MKTEVISIGTELLMGYVIDTNSSTIAKELLGMGIGTYYRQIVGDNPKRLKESIQLAAQRSDLIILSGGLGPTKDDITKEVLADFVGDKLIEDPKQLEKIVSYYKNKNELPDNMYRQAHTLKRGTTFFNDVGLACGTAYVHEKEDGTSQYFIVLPGPPFEMLHMITHYVKPYLQEHVQENGVITSLYMNLYGIGESRVAELLDDLVENQTNPTVAIYAKPRQVTVRLTANAPDSDTAQTMNQALAETVLEKVGPYFIGYGEARTIESFVIEQLKENKQTISVIETFTGGAVMSAIAALPGVSSVFSGGRVSYSESPMTEEQAKGLAEDCLTEFHTDSGLSIVGNLTFDQEKIGSGELYIAFAQTNKETQVKTYPLTNRPTDVLRTIAKNESFAFLSECLTNEA